VTDDERRTGRLRHDAALDLGDLLVDLARTVLKTVVAIIVLRTVAHLEYQVAVEVGALLGCADFFSRRRDFRCTSDVRDKISITRSRGSINVTEEHQEHRSVPRGEEEKCS
jgi:hypothetical protein